MHAQRTYLALQPLRMEATQASEYQKQVQELRTEVEHHACCSIEKLTVLVLQVQGEIDLQIEKLEQKLAELHATDVKALDRAHKSLCQHIDALQLESTVSVFSDAAHIFCVLCDLSLAGLSSSSS